MPNRNVQITDYDKKQIEELLLRGSLSGKYYEELEEQLGRAEIVASDELDSDVVTINTKLRVMDLDTRQKTRFPMHLVFPPDADMDENKISVLSPAGTALLGSRVGDTISWYVPEHARLFSPRPFRHLKIEEIVHRPKPAELLYF